VNALEERMKMLRSPGVQDYIKPIDDEAVFKIYDLYEGDIRSIMTAIRDILGQFSDRLAKPLNASQAMLLLGKERWERVVRNKLHKEQQEILKFIVAGSEYVTQKDVAEKMRKNPANVSAYYFKPLLQNGIIEEKERQGKTILYGLTVDYEPLKWFFEARTEFDNQIKHEVISIQRSLFGE
jgi:hypothetical protein